MDYMTYVWIGLVVIALVAVAVLMSKLDERMLAKAELAEVRRQALDDLLAEDALLLDEPVNDNAPKFDPVEAGATLVKKAKPKKAAAKKPVKQAAKKPARKRA